MLHCRLTGQQRAWEPLSDSGLWPLISEMKSCRNNQQLHHHKTAINGLNITTNRITWNEIIIFKLWGGISQGRKGCHLPIFLPDMMFCRCMCSRFLLWLVISLPLSDVTLEPPLSDVSGSLLTQHPLTLMGHGTLYEVSQVTAEIETWTWTWGIPGTTLECFCQAWVQAQAD